MAISKWDLRMLELAEHVAQWSKDPSTKTGAVVANGNQVISVGYNGFPPGVGDTPDRLDNREIKYKIVLHAEDNALYFAGNKAKGSTLYVVGLAPCVACASKIIRSGVSRVVAKAAKSDRWHDDNMLASQLFSETSTLFDWIQE